MAAIGFGEIAEQLRRSTVLIRVRGMGSGSGVIWSSDGTLITNAHVARESRLAVQLWDAREFQAAVAARDTRRDLAVLKIPAADLPAAKIAGSSAPRPGQLVIAIGNPLGFVGALTTGIIHAVGPLRGLGSHSWIQSQVRLAPGNSGGPLADAHGRVIGINTMIAGRLALAIPSDAVTALLTNGISTPYLGVVLHPVKVPPRARTGAQGRFGLLVLEVEPGTSASTASLLPGDILIGTDEKPFSSIADLQSLLDASHSRVVRFHFLRGDYTRVRRVAVQLGRRAPAAAYAAA